MRPESKGILSYFAGGGSERGLISDGAFENQTMSEVVREAG